MRIELHPVTPQSRLISRFLDVLEKDGIIVYPTDSGYSLGCNALSPKGVKKLYHAKRAMKKYLMALMARDYSVITEFAKIDNAAFRILKRYTPGPFTFILPATQRCKKMLEVNRPEVGIRIPDCPFANALWGSKPDLILLTTAARIREDDTFIDAQSIEDAFGHEVDLIADMGEVPIDPTTVVSLVTGGAEVIREGAGDWKG